MASKVDPGLLETIKALAASRADMAALAAALATAEAQAPRQSKRLFAACGLGTSAGYALMAIGRKLPELGKDRARLNRIGWQKLRSILPRLGSMPLNELLELAEATTGRDLSDVLKGRPPPTGARRIEFLLAPDEERRLRAALVLFGAHMTRRGLKRKEAALMRLVATVSEDAETHIPVQHEWSTSCTTTPNA